MFELVNLHLQDRRQACQAMAGVGTGLPGQQQMADKMLFFTFVARGLSMPGAAILKQEMLSKGGEAALHHQAVVFGVELSLIHISKLLKKLFSVHLLPPDI